MMVECLMHPRPEPIAEALRGRAEGLATSLVSDAFGRWAGGVGILPVTGLRPGQVVAGTALTVRTRPGDNLVVHKALDLGRPGDVLVVAAGGDPGRAVLGGLMGQYAATRGFVALVVDGAVRDRSDLDRLAPPVFATALSHLGPYKDGPGELHGPVAVGGVVACDGDLVIADEDGVTVVPRARADEIVAAAEKLAEAEQAESSAIAKGQWDRTWLEAALEIRPAPDRLP